MRLCIHLRITLVCFCMQNLDVKMHYFSICTVEFFYLSHITSGFPSKHTKVRISTGSTIYLLSLKHFRGLRALLPGPTDPQLFSQAQDLNQQPSNPWYRGLIHGATHHMLIRRGSIWGAPAAPGYLRLALDSVLSYGDGVGGVGELWCPGACHHGQQGRRATDAQLVSRHHGEQVLPVLLQRKPRHSHLPAPPVYFKAAVAPCRREDS